MDPEKLLEQLKTFKANMEKAISDKLTEQSTKSDTDIAALKSQLDETKTSIKTLEDNIKAADHLHIPGLADEQKTNPFSWQKFSFAAIAAKNGNLHAWDMAPHEKEVLDAHKKALESAVTKDHIAGDGSQGGYLIPDEVTSEIVSLAIAKMVMPGMGCTEYRGLVGDLPIPRVTGRNTGYWLGETEAPTESSGSFGEFTLRPKKVGAFTKFSRRLSYQSRQVADTIIKQNLIDSLALKIDLGFHSGLGNENQPRGILNQSGMTSTTAIGTNGGRLIIDKAAEMAENIDVADELVEGGNFGYIMHPRVLGGMRRERVTQYSGQAIGQGMPLTPLVLISPQQLEAMLGYKIRTTTQMSATLTKGTSSTCSYVVFGNFKQFYLGFWRGLEIKVSEHASDASGNSSFLKDQIYMLAIQEVDSNVGRATAFTMLSDAETTPSLW